jgi:hypothetical protein
MAEPKLNLAPIQDALGDEMPEISPTPLGRYRLVTALQYKFGNNYRNIPKARAALEHFDSEHEFFQKYRRIKAGA